MSSFKSARWINISVRKRKPGFRLWVSNWLFEFHPKLLFANPSNELECAHLNVASKEGGIASGRSYLATSNLGSLAKPNEWGRSAMGYSANTSLEFHISCCERSFLLFGREMLLWWRVWQKGYPHLPSLLLFSASLKGADKSPLSPGKTLIVVLNRWRKSSATLWRSMFSSPIESHIIVWFISFLSGERGFQSSSFPRFTNLLSYMTYVIFKDTYSNGSVIKHHSKILPEKPTTYRRNIRWETTFKPSQPQPVKLRRSISRKH